MGIRYYAYPIEAEDYVEAVADPCRFLSSNPLFDAWGSPADKPEMLYLDKAWHELQRLLTSENPLEPRPAHQLVAGDVTNTYTGWIPFEKALSADQVREIAADLATVDDSDIRDLHARSGPWWSNDTPEETFTYVSGYLADAKEFVQALALNGRGLVYVIG